MISWQKFCLWNAGRRNGKPPEEYLTDDFLCWVRYEILKAIPFHLFGKTFWVIY